jgi:hypothetical protein
MGRSVTGKKVVARDRRDAVGPIDLIAKEQVGLIGRTAAGAKNFNMS